MSRANRVFLVVSIDTECDKGPGWKTQRPLQFRSVMQGIPEVLTPLLREHGLISTYLLSPEVIGCAEAVHVLAGLEDCELGTHLHSEFVEPEAEYDAAVTSRPQLAYSPGVERQKLSNLTRAFKDSFGRMPTSFRAGRFGLSDYSLGFLAQLGYRVDSSVTPFRTHNFGPDVWRNYWGAPLEPYRPSDRDPRCKGTLPLLEVPVSITVPVLSGWPLAVLRLMNDDTRWYKRVLLRLGKDPRASWIRPFRGTADDLITGAEHIIASWRGRSVPVINVMFHSVEVMPGASPYAYTPEDVGTLVRDLDRLFGHIRRRYDVRSLSLTGLWSEFTNRWQNDLDRK